MTYYIHCDLNKFYASILRSFLPWLEGKPVVVLSNNDGCSICQTKEAERFGFEMGSKAFEMEHIIKKYDIQVYSTNFTLIADMSLRVKSILKRYFTDLEDYSIDEVFCQVSGLPEEEVLEHARQVVHVVKQGLGLPISIGIGTSKTLAKVATRFAKRHSGYKGVCMIDTEEKRIKALKLFEIGDVWGIGRKHKRRLNSLGVQTAYDFTQMTTAWVRKEMTVTGLRTYRELLGEPCIPMELVVPKKKNIMVSRSFGTMLPDLKTISEALITYECMAAAKLRKQLSNAKALYVFLHTNEFREELPQYYADTVVKTMVPTNSSIELAKYTHIALKKLYKPGFMYKKAGVMMMDISDSNAVQLNIFDKLNREKHNRLMEAMDRINAKHGRNTLSLVSAGDGKKWWIRQEKLCPCWTTRLSDLPIAK